MTRAHYFAGTIIILSALLYSSEFCLTSNSCGITNIIAPLLLSVIEPTFFALAGIIPISVLFCFMNAEIFRKWIGFLPVFLIGFGCIFFLPTHGGQWYSSWVLTREVGAYLWASALTLVGVFLIVRQHRGR